MSPARVTETFQAYLRADRLRISRAEFERNLARKARSRAFLSEVRGTLAPGIAYDPEAALDLVRRDFVERLAGAGWKG